MATGYEIRHSLLNEAKIMLFDQWHQECDRLRRNAELAQTQLEQWPDAPSASEIKALAEELYEFVQRK
jgi:hypothetical protein